MKHLDEMKALNAKTTADTEQQLVEAQRSILINDEKGKAQLKLADYERQAYEKIITALGQENAAKLEMIRLAGEKNVVITPQVFLGNESGNAIAGAILAKPTLK